MCSQVDPYLEKPKTLYDADLLISNFKQNIIFGCTRPTHFDSWDSESYFKALLSCLQNHNINTLYVPDLKNDPTCKLQGNEQLHITAYLADTYKCNITICESRIKYPTPDEIPEILKSFHDDPLAGHRGEFVNNILKQLVKLLGSQHTFSTAYHPQTNGSLERFHAVLRDHIRMYSTKTSHDWDRRVPLAIMCHNTSLNQSTGFTPHELLFGYRPRLLYTFKETREYTTNDYLNDLNERLKVSRDIAQRNINEMKEKAKVRYDSQIKNIADFKLGDHVMLRVPNPNNLDSKWVGPYKIIRKVFNENYLIRKSGKNQLVHGNRLRPVQDCQDK